MAPDRSPTPEDPTPVVGAATDVSALGRGGVKPPHERTAAEDADVVNWQALAGSDAFKRLVRAKKRFVVPAMIFFVLYYFALPVLVGYARPLMETRVIGAVNIAYLFALSQFIMAWIIAALYVRAAARFDRMADDVIAQQGTGSKR